MTRTALSLVILAATVVPVFASGAGPEGSAGASLAIESDRLDPALLHCRVVWTEPAPLARVTVRGPRGTVVLGTPDAVWTTMEETTESRTTTTLRAGVGAGEGTELLLDLGAVAAPATVVVVGERVLPAVTLQVVVRVQVGDSGVAVGAPAAYRLTEIAEEAAPWPGGWSDPERPVAALSKGSVLIEPLSPLKATVTSVFGEDNDVVPIPDGPTTCSGPNWTVQRTIDISSAPATAVVTGYLVHVTVTHPRMADLDIGFFQNPGNGNYLWHNGAGVNLDRDYTTDMYGQPLDGIGEAVNALYMLSLRDCVAGSTGSLDYWSVRVYYDTTPTIDLVADSIAASPNQVAPGGSVAATWAGHVAGSGTVGGPFTVGFYLSSDATITTSDVLLGQVTVSSANAPGDTFGEASPGRTLTIPAATAAGSYYLGLIVDSANVIDESNESNNVTSAPLTVAEAGVANLQMLSCSVNPSTVEAGQALTLTWSGTNSGTAPSGAFLWAVYLSTDVTIDPAADTLLSGPVSAAGWPAGYTTGDRTRTVTVPGGTANGTYYVGVYLDTAFAVTETSEADNSCATPLAVSSAAAGVTHWLVPAAASTPGFGTSNWRSEVAIVNPTASARTASLYYVAKGTSWPGALLYGPTTISANQSSYLDDPLLAQNPTSGLLYVVLDAAGPVVTSRTYNLGDGGATYGQGIPALPLDGVSAPTELILPMVHSVPGRFHTNLGLVQTSSGSYQVEVTAYSPGGSSLAVKSYTRSTAYDQINDLFSNLGLASLSVEGAWLRVRLVSGTPAYWTCYASVVDDQTGDPTFVAPVQSE